jgi:hypothetical protein
MTEKQRNQTDRVSMDTVNETKIKIENYILASYFLIKLTISAAAPPSTRMKLPA